MVGVAGYFEEIDKSGKRTLSATFRKIIPFKPPHINIYKGGGGAADLRTFGPPWFGPFGAHFFVAFFACVFYIII